MDIAEKEYRKKNENKEIKKPLKTTTTPSWFNKDIEEDSATEEEIRAFEELLRGNK